MIETEAVCPVVNRVMVSRDIHFLILWTSKDDTLHAKKDFEGMTTLKTLTWGNHLGLSRWTQCNHKVFIEKKRQIVILESGKWDMMIEIVGMMWVEDEGRGYDPRNAGGF